MLGTDLEVPTLDGKVKMKVPAGIKNNQLLRLKGKGIAGLNRHRNGDLYIKINIKTIESPNAQVKEIIKDLQKNINDKIEFKKLKNYE